LKYNPFFFVDLLLGTNDYKQFVNIFSLVQR